MPAMPASTRLIGALRDQGYKPVRLSTGRWLAICPCCGRLDLTVGEPGPITAAERDEWLDVTGAAPAG